MITFVIYRPGFVNCSLTKNFSKIFFFLYFRKQNLRFFSQQLKKYDACISFFTQMLVVIDGKNF